MGQMRWRSTVMGPVALESARPYRERWGSRVSRQRGDEAVNFVSGTAA